MPSSPPQPALSLGIGSFIVRQRVAFQKTVQDVRVRRLAHKDQGFGMQLTHTLAGETQIGSDLTIDGWRLAVQTIASHDDVPQTLGQTLHGIVEYLALPLPIPLRDPLHRGRYEHH